MELNGFVLQIILGTWVTIKLAITALSLGLVIGLFGAVIESIRSPFLRYPLASIIFLVRSLPELLILFFMYFGMTALLSKLFNHYVDISAFIAGAIALGLIFGAYASQVFRGAFLAIDAGQIQAAQAMGLTRWQTFRLIEVPQALRHALPGLGNLWLILLKDTAIVTLIGLQDMMNEAKIAATTTNQPFTYYFIAAIIYLLITSFSEQILKVVSAHANRYVH